MGGRRLARVEVGLRDTRQAVPVFLELLLLKLLHSEVRSGLSHLPVPLHLVDYFVDVLLEGGHFEIGLL